MKLIYISLISSALLFGCDFSQNPQSKRKTQSLIKYLEYRREFDHWLVKHFPNDFSGETFSFSSSKNFTKHDMGFYLYEYDVSISALQALQKRVEKKAVAHYQTDDSLLFVINRFETLKTDYERSIPKIKNLLYIDSSLFAGLYPVPNFLEYEKPISTRNGIWLPKDFDLYVLEAKSGVYCKEFDLKENFQMPKGWKNGFSRGVAINKKDRTVIYWGVLW